VLNREGWLNFVGFNNQSFWKVF